MILKDFIEQLQALAAAHGDDAKVIMADHINIAPPEMSPRYTDFGFSEDKQVIIADELQ